VVGPLEVDALSCCFHLDGDINWSSGECSLPNGKRYRLTLTGPTRFHVRDESARMAVRA